MRDYEIRSNRCTLVPWASLSTNNGFLRGDTHQHQMRRQKQKREPSQGGHAFSFLEYHNCCVGNGWNKGKSMVWPLNHTWHAKLKAWFCPLNYTSSKKAEQKTERAQCNTFRAQLSCSCPEPNWWQETAHSRVQEKTDSCSAKARAERASIARGSRRAYFSKPS